MRTYTRMRTTTIGGFLFLNNFVKSSFGYQHFAFSLHYHVKWRMPTGRHTVEVRNKKCSTRINMFPAMLICVSWAQNPKDKKLGDGSPVGYVLYFGWYFYLISSTHRRCLARAYNTVLKQMSRAVWRERQQRWAWEKKETSSFLFYPGKMYRKSLTALFIPDDQTFFFFLRLTEEEEEKIKCRV